MFKGALIELLTSFSPTEMKSFRDFVRSPFHNKNQSAVKLLSVFSKRYPDFSGMSKQKIFKQIYGNRKYNEQTMKSVIFALSKLAEKFLLYRALDKNEFEKSIMLLKEFSERKIEKLYLKKFNEAEEFLEGESEFGLEFFGNKRILETIKTDHLIDRKDMYKFRDEVVKRDEYVLLDSIRRLLLSLQDIYLLKYELNLDASENLAAETFKFIDMAKIVETVKASDISYSHVIELKYNEVLAMMNLDTESYLRYKNLAYENLDKFTWTEQHQTFGVMASICIMAQNKGADGFGRELLTVSKMMIDQNSHSYYESEYTNIQGYFNLLSEFVENNEDVYFEKLIRNFGSRLNPEYRESVINYSLMRKKFQEKKFEEALDYYARVDYNHSLLKYKSRILLMKIYYELKYTEELINLLDSSRKFFSAVDHYSEINISRYLNFIKYLKKLVLYQETHRREKIPELKSEILSKDNINNKDWLIEKCGFALL